ncbi:hypothetical protein ACGTN9_11755 [Halobacillus sp. MO56]
MWGQMFIRKSKAWVVTTFLSIMVYAVLWPHPDSLLLILPVFIAIGAGSSMLIDWLTVHYRYRLFWAAALHLVAAFIIHQLFVIDIWSPAFYYFALPIATTYWLVDEYIRRRYVR